MNKIKEYKWFILIIILVLLLSFYWFEYRPSQIKKECSIWAVNQAKGGGLTAYLKENYNSNVYNDYYTRCLREKGL